VQFKISAADLQQLTGGIKREEPSHPHLLAQHQTRVPFSLSDSSTVFMMQDYGPGGTGTTVTRMVAQQRTEEEYFRVAAAMASVKHQQQAGLSIRV